MTKFPNPFPRSCLNFKPLLPREGEEGKGDRKIGWPILRDLTPTPEFPNPPDLPFRSYPKEGRNWIDTPT